MVDIDRARWVPPRPPRDRSVWGQNGGVPQEGPRVPAVPSPVPDLPPTRPRPARPPRGRVAGAWAHTSLARRIVLSYAVVAVAIGGVVGVGAVVQPDYGALTPYSGVGVDDVRSAPGQSAWAVDLASTLAPGAPADCLRFSAVDVGQSLVAVHADSAWDSGYSAETNCSIVPAGFRSRIALLDTADGSVRWVHDTAIDVQGGDGIAISWVSVLDSGTKLLVRTGTSDTTVVETLSTGTGQVLTTTGTRSWNDDDRFTASGSVVALGRQSSDGLSYVYELRDAHQLWRVVWRGTGNETATMIALDDRLLLGSTGTIQIPLSTGVPKPWNGPVNTSLGYAIHDGIVYAGRVTGSGVTTHAAGGFSAVSSSGKVLWSSDLDLRGSFSLGRDCLVVTNLRGDELTCLDYATGAVRWQRDTGSYSYTGSAVGQRTDDVYTVSTEGDPEIVALDGSSGRVRFRTPVPSGTSVVAAGHTVGYALSYGVTGSRTTVVAFDVSSGRRLWTRTSTLQVGVWGGHLIDVGVDGLARRWG